MMSERIDAVGLDGALFERDVTRTLERVSKAGGLTIHWSIPRTRDALGHSGVQPWSAGAIFPATIATVESYATYSALPCIEHLNGDGYRACAACADQPSVSYRLTLDGHSEEYATYDDAESVARALLERPDLRASWNADEDATLPGVDAYGVT